MSEEKKVHEKKIKVHIRNLKKGPGVRIKTGERTVILVRRKRFIFSA